MLLLEKPPLSPGGAQDESLVVLVVEDEFFVAKKFE